MVGRAQRAISKTASDADNFYIRTVITDVVAFKEGCSHGAEVGS